MKNYPLFKEDKVLKKKILFLIDSLNYGGVETVLVQIVNQLDPLKYDITVLSIRNEGGYIDKLKPNIKLKYIVDEKHPNKNKWFYRCKRSFYFRRKPLNIFKLPQIPVYSFRK